MQKLDRSFFRGMWKLTKLYWQSTEKWRALLLLVAIIILALGHVYMLVLFNEWYNEFYSALQNYDKTGALSSIGRFFILAVIYIIIQVYEIYLRQMLEIKWRNWLTRYYLKQWLSKQAYYMMQVFYPGADNPDQRISEDIRSFVSLTLGLSLGLLRATVTLISFIIILWNLSGVLTVPFQGHEYAIPGYMVWLSLVYSAVGTWLTVKIGWPLVGLNFDQQRYEANFRFNLVRIRENSESIALYSGEPREEQGLVNRFSQVVANYWQLIKRQKKLTWFTAGYGQLAAIFPLLIAMPRYFSKQIALGGLLQTVSAFRQVQDALSFFVDNYSTLAEWQAVVNRLLGFIENVDKVQAVSHEKQLKTGNGSENTMTVAGLDVLLPDGESLLQGLTFTLKKGEDLLITGPSGSGKSTLLRALAGIWPFCHGTMQLPTPYSVMFSPQKPYLPLGSLRDSLLYPTVGKVVDDCILENVLIRCKLNHLAGQLDRSENWSHILSLGEQQRIAFARALIMRPDWLFLDEATSGLDEDLELTMYQLVSQELQDTTVISVGHRTTLTGCHSLKLTILEKGRWQIVPITEKR